MKNCLLTFRNEMNAKTSPLDFPADLFFFVRAVGFRKSRSASAARFLSGAAGCFRRMLFCFLQFRRGSRAFRCSFRGRFCRILPMSSCLLSSTTRTDMLSIGRGAIRSTCSRFPKECSRSSFFLLGQELARLGSSPPSGSMFRQIALRTVLCVGTRIPNPALKGRRIPANVRSRMSIVCS